MKTIYNTSVLHDAIMFPVFALVALAAYGCHKAVSGSQKLIAPITVEAKIIAPVMATPKGPAGLNATHVRANLTQSD